MAVEVLIKRKVTEEKVDELAPLIVKMRSLATTQPGYASAETLRCIDPPGGNEYVVRSTWNSIEDWRKWLQSEERNAIQTKMDPLLEEPTQYRVYEPLVSGIMGIRK